MKMKSSEVSECTHTKEDAHRKPKKAEDKSEQTTVCIIFLK